MMFKSGTKRSFGYRHPNYQTLHPEYCKKMGIKSKNILRNLSVPDLYEAGLGRKAADPITRDSLLCSTGAFCAFSGDKTGRSPIDKRTVCDEVTKDKVWWGDINIPFPESSYELTHDLVKSYLNHKDRLYVVDGYLGWDEDYRRKVRIFCTRAYHAMFMTNMLIRPTVEQLETDFAGDVDFHVWNAGEYEAPLKGIEGANPRVVVGVHYEKGEISILGTQYAGEMKKGLFGVMHYEMPKLGVASLHASANEGKVRGDTTLLFGLSGTGKTTLSADPKRVLIGDDEHCWTDKGIFNMEGGCYAKCVNLSQEKEPDIYNSLKFGAVLENVLFSDDHHRIVDYTRVDITENTRASYPLEYIPGCKLPAVGGHPENVIFLTCDAYGVLPPVSKLTYEQAMMQFVSGFTAKVAGTEIGITDPVPTFSACFGEAFIPYHPFVYAEILGKMIQKHGTKCWLVNSGWAGGPYGVGQRMDIATTRSVLDAIHSGELNDVPCTKLPYFGMDVPTECPGVADPSILDPKAGWPDKEKYDRSLRNLAASFKKNFKRYTDRSSEDIMRAVPKV